MGSEMCIRDSLKKVDLMGASFAASNNATRFWIQNGYTPFHLGSVADKSTGEVSLAVVKTVRPRVGLDEPLLFNLFVYESPRPFRNEIISELCEQTILTSHDIERLEEIFLQRILDYINDSRSHNHICLLYTSPSPRDLSTSRMPSSA